MSKREQREAAKELAARKREINREAKERKRSIAAEVRAGERELDMRDKAQKKARRDARNVYDAIGFNRMYMDGTCEVEDGMFSQTVSFSDISYQSASTEQQKALFNIYAEILNYCNTDTNLQLNIVNTPISKYELGHKVFFEETGDAALDEYVEEYNEVLNKKMLQGVSNLDRMRYLTFAIPASTYEEAIPSLQRTYVDISSTLSKLGCDEIHRLNGQERLALIASQLHPLKEYAFEYDELLVNGMTSKDSVCPMSLDFKPENMNDVFKSDGVWCQALVMEKIGSQLTDNSLSQLADLPIPINVCVHMQPLDNALDFVKSRLGWMDKEIIEAQRDAVRKGYNPDILPQELAFSKNEGEELLNELQYKNQRLFRFVGVVYTYAETFEALREQAKRIIDIARKQGIIVNVLDNRQREGMNSMIPVGNPHLKSKRYLTTANVAIMMPFATQEVNQEHGGFYGQNKTSSNLIMVNRKKLAAPMGFVLGKPGSGKSFGVKREITNTFLQNPDDEVIIIDPNMEYPPLVEALGGTAFVISPTSEHHINVFDLFSGEHTITGTDPFVFKTEAIMAITSVVIGDAKGNLTPEERTIIDRCLRETYAQARTTGTTPVLGDFYEVLKKQNDQAASRLVTAFELYVEGGLNYFNNQTNVDIDRRIISFSFKQLSGTMRIFAMLVLMDLTYNRMLYNFERGVTTWVYIDEMQTLFSIPSVVEYFDRFWSEGRKFNLIPTGISQLPERILEHEKAKYLLMNSDFIMLFKQSDRDRVNLSALLGLSPLQEEAVSRTTDVGHGLLVAGAAIIPFKDEWPKGKLYDLWNTKPEEIAEQKRQLRQAQPAWVKEANEQNFSLRTHDRNSMGRPAIEKTTEPGAASGRASRVAVTGDGRVETADVDEAVETVGADVPAEQKTTNGHEMQPEKQEDRAQKAVAQKQVGPKQAKKPKKADAKQIEQVRALANLANETGSWSGTATQAVEAAGLEMHPPHVVRMLNKHVDTLEELGVKYTRGKNGIIELRMMGFEADEVPAEEPSESQTKKPSNQETKMEEVFEAADREVGVEGDEDYADEDDLSDIMDMVFGANSEQDAVESVEDGGLEPDFSESAGSDGEPEAYSDQCEVEGVEDELAEEADEAADEQAEEKPRKEQEEPEKLEARPKKKRIMGMFGRRRASATDADEENQLEEVAAELSTLDEPEIPNEVSGKVPEKELETAHQLQDDADMEKPAVPNRTARQRRRNHHASNDGPVLKKCRKCENLLQATDVFCPKCGNKVD